MTSRSSRSRTKRHQDLDQLDLVQVEMMIHLEELYLQVGISLEVKKEENNKK